jgi:tripartite-type tricarboxylate transporter receptor subunit TctC
VEFVPCSLPEARSLIDAGKVRALTVMASQRAALFPDVPTLKEATGLTWTAGAWRGIAAPKGIPADVQARLEASVKKAWDSKEYKDFMAQRGFGVLWGNAQEFASFMAKGDADMKTVMTAVGIAK